MYLVLYVVKLIKSVYLGLCNPGVCMNEALGWGCQVLGSQAGCLGVLFSGSVPVVARSQQMAGWDGGC